MRFIALIVLLCLSYSLQAQETFKYNGVHQPDQHVWYIYNATIVVSPDKVINRGQLIVKDGRIEQVGSDLNLPAGAIQVDAQGGFIMSGIVDARSSFGMPDVPPQQWEWEEPNYDPQRMQPVGWNDAIKSSVRAADIFTPTEKEAETLRSFGIGAVQTYNQDGIARGTSMVSLTGNGRSETLVVRDKVGAHFSFNKGTSEMPYPNSEMGSIALLRQFVADADWYARGGNNVEFNASLQALQAQRELPWFFEAESYRSALRASRWAEESGKQLVVAGSGDEYQRIAEVVQHDDTWILPVNFPAAYDTKDPYDRRWISYNQAKHWQMAPYNLRIVDENGVEFCITTSGCESPKEFWKNMRLAVEKGLTQESAIRALTVTPAKVLGVSSDLGTLEEGKIANFVIWSGSPFTSDASLHQTWVGGKQYNIQDMKVNLAGAWNFKLDCMQQIEFAGTITNTKKGYAFEIDGVDSTSSKSVSISVSSGAIGLDIHGYCKEDSTAHILCSGFMSGNTIRGLSHMPSGETAEWVLSRSATDVASIDEQEAETTAKPDVPAYRVPLHGFGQTALPKQEHVLIRNATVWTSGPAGVIENCDVLFNNGKIVRVGQNLSASGAIVIDGTGKHVTPGIIDEHAHIAIENGVNEASQASTAEVRIGDVVDPDDLTIYRQLAGGVTSSHLLHGSANPIGGQSQLIKLRWGQGSEELKYTDNDPFIKFALGENVKQSNWGDFFTVRYPQTRMGVEQIFVDRFTRARAYEQAWKEYNSSGKRGTPPRTDYELETLLQILNSERFITCHSYVQSEITMLMRVAEQFDFRVNTFTHILEGYKVADKMREHGVAGSTFSDWWAYKYEVIDAIPYNAAIMHNEGVLTCLNSDSHEMARRLHSEAGKIVKYGGVSQEEALKMVTINPAKILHVDNSVGSLEAGKDADVVLWNGNPLSTRSLALATWVDGKRMFDIEQDKQLQQEANAELEELLNMMAADNSPNKQKAQQEHNHGHGCLDKHDHAHPFLNTQVEKK